MGKGDVSGDLREAVSTSPPPPTLHSPLQTEDSIGESPLPASWEARSQTQSLTPSDPSIPVPSPRSPSGNHGTDRRAVERALGLEEK